MSAATITLVRSRSKKLMKFGLSIFRRRFNSSKCKTWAKMVTARIKLLRNKRQVVVRQMRRDVALLLESGQDATARIRVEHVIREQNIMAANEIIELFCDHLVARLSIIAKQRVCPGDLKEGISSLIFAAPRCSEIPELLAIRDLFEKKYGKDFVSAATDLRPESGVNRLLIEKLSVRNPTGEVKLKVMKEIAKEYQVDWNTEETEMELLKPPEERIEGPRTFVGASTLPLKPEAVRSVESEKPSTRVSSHETSDLHFRDATSAAKAAAESAKNAVAAAQAAATFARRESGINEAAGFDGYVLSNSIHQYTASGSQAKSQYEVDKSEGRGRNYQSDRFACYQSANNEDVNPQDVDVDVDDRLVKRRHSYNIPSIVDDDRKDLRRNSYNTDIKFDESDCDEDIEIDQPPSGIHSPPGHAPPPMPSVADKNGHARVHPKLPDYDILAARFESLKYHRSQP